MNRLIFPKYPVISLIRLLNYLYSGLINGSINYFPDSFSDPEAGSKNVLGLSKFVP